MRERDFKKRLFLQKKILMFALFTTVELGLRKYLENIARLRNIC